MLKWTMIIDLTVSDIVEDDVINRFRSLKRPLLEGSCREDDLPLGRLVGVTGPP